MWLLQPISNNGTENSKYAIVRAKCFFILVFIQIRNYPIDGFVYVHYRTGVINTFYSGIAILKLPISNPIVSLFLGHFINS